jgi:oligosaccharyltransferase complex subunit beta
MLSHKIIFSLLIFQTLIQQIFLTNLNNFTTNTNDKRSKALTLVLLDDLHYIESHSMFWDQLRKLDLELEIKLIDDPSIQLTNFGEYIYQNIIFFAPTFSDDLAKKNELTIPNILKFIDKGHNIMIFTNYESGNYVRKLVTEFGADFDDYVLFYIYFSRTQELKIVSIFIHIKIF